MQAEFIRRLRRNEQHRKIGPFQLETGQITQEECRIKIGAVKDTHGNGWSNTADGGVGRTVRSGSTRCMTPAL